jgi:hypothetical protein
VIVVLSAVPGVAMTTNPLNLLGVAVIAVPTNLALDAGVLTGATVAGITVASLLLPRLAR